MKLYNQGIPFPCLIYLFRQCLLSIYCVEDIVLCALKYIKQVKHPWPQGAQKQSRKGSSVVINLCGRRSSEEEMTFRLRKHARQPKGGGM